MITRAAKRCSRDPVEVLGEQPLFASLVEGELRQLAGRSACRQLTAGIVVFREKEPCRGLHLVLEGAVSLYRSNRHGQTQTLHVAQPGDSLGEVALFDGGPYLSSARVTVDSHLLFLPFAEVRALYARHPEVAHAVVADMGRRLRGMIALVDRITLQDVTSRVAWALHTYAERTAGPVVAGVTFTLPRTQEDLAEEVGTTRESVARSFRRFRERGVIRQRGRRIEVLDPAALREWAGS
jgi:CRP/FNR family transcriptional regulator, cyclic AMP receptor protein